MSQPTAKRWKIWWDDVRKRTWHSTLKSQKSSLTRKKHGEHSFHWVFTEDLLWVHQHLLYSREGTALLYYLRRANLDQKLLVNFYWHESGEQNYHIIENTQKQHCMRRAARIINPQTHPRKILFILLPSIRNYRLIHTCTNKLKDSLFSKAHLKTELK